MYVCCMKLFIALSSVDIFSKGESGLGLNLFEPALPATAAFSTGGLPYPSHECEKGWGNRVGSRGETDLSGALPRHLRDVEHSLSSTGFRTWAACVSFPPLCVTFPQLPGQVRTYPGDDRRAG